MLIDDQTQSTAQKAKAIFCEQLERFSDSNEE
jgi:hypothetical protein